MTGLASIRRLDLTEWTPGIFDEPRGDLLYFYRQNKRLCDTLLEIRGIAAVAARLKTMLTAYPSDGFDVQRVWLAIPPLQVKQVVLDAADDDPYWPLFVSVRQERAEADDEKTYAVRLVWRTEHFGSHIDVKGLRELLAAEFPDLRKLESRNIRRIIRGRNLKFDAAVKTATDLVGRMNALLETALSTR